ncbi:PAP2-domain-containing protein [Microstroma glucosiphilum]|uniref:Dolichyldiphosphatase n=1 Tax=Pseudomicrostroma glucosiphilum TaxID=1684307 RepID=A0A316U6U7_9BASI|nr:PAP2-domain-containing protein [Pseudomicrostroma glucosiphilum]PWN20073.1 PAP2-domain-containing protein [Pseudomicrostroma glucosiphilum]
MLSGKAAGGSSLDPGKYVALGLTHVQYDGTDKLAKLLALVTLSPIFLLCAYVTIIIYRRELTFINALVGQLGCEGINWGLKRLIRQPRPYGHLGKGYGMPSSHSQFIGFFCAFFLSHFYLHHPKAAVPRTLVNTMRRFEHLFAMLAIAGLTAATCYSRYHLSYHTPLQIFVGLFTGLAIGFVYYYLTEYLPRQPLRLPAPFRSAAASPESSPVREPVRTTSLRRRSRNGSNDATRPSERTARSSRSAGPSASSAPAAPPRQSSLNTHRRRSSLSSLLKTELYPAPPIRQLILDHPLAVAFRLRDSWTVWLDGGIEGEYEAWRSEWERRRKPYPSDWKRGIGQDQQQTNQRLNSIAEKLDGFMLDGPGDEQSAVAKAKGGVAMLSGGPSSSGSSSGQAYSQDLETNFAADTKSNLADGGAQGAASGSGMPSTSAAGAGAVPTTSAATPLKLMKLALRQASRCEPTSTAFCVGCIIAVSGSEEVVATGFSRELEGNTHAEQCALDKLVSSPGRIEGEEAKTGEETEVLELDLYTTMEPCSERLSGATPCAQRILSFNQASPLLSLPPSLGTGSATSPVPRQARARIVRVYQGVSEPEDFIKDNVGLNLLRGGGIEVVRVVEGQQREKGEEEGWIEREALRLAKWGHEDQAHEKEGESRFWKEEGGEEV